MKEKKKNLKCKKIFSLFIVIYILIGIVFILNQSFGRNYINISSWYYILISFTISIINLNIILSDIFLNYNYCAAFINLLLFVWGSLEMQMGKNEHISKNLWIFSIIMYVFQIILIILFLLIIPILYGENKNIIEILN